MCLYFYMMAKQSKIEKAKAHKGLEDFSIRLNSFGQIETTIEIDQLNAFLNEHVQDKKLHKPKDEADNASKTEKE